MLLLKIDHIGHAHLVNVHVHTHAILMADTERKRCRIRDLFLVTTLRYAASDNFNYLRGCLTLLPSIFSWAPDSYRLDSSKLTHTRLAVSQSDRFAVTEVCI